MDDTDSFPDRDPNILGARVPGDPLGLLAGSDAATVAYLERLALMFSPGHGGRSPAVLPSDPRRSNRSGIAAPASLTTPSRRKVIGTEK